MDGFKNSTKTKYYTGGPVKTGDKRDAEYGDYVIAAKQSADRSKGTPIKEMLEKRGPVKKTYGEKDGALKDALKKSLPVKKEGYAKGGDVVQDKALVKGAVHKHERNMHPGKTPTKLRKGGMTVAYKCGGKVYKAT